MFSAGCVSRGFNELGNCGLLTSYNTRIFAVKMAVTDLFISVLGCFAVRYQLDILAASFPCATVACSGIRRTQMTSCTTGIVVTSLHPLCRKSVK